ncbi:uncharacterized protein LAESUDRAFT_734247 [Laetiporus sulphureus 93-53]|uniref:Man1/Src1-like C-terminal domain-containing protein n=1 Tax=Laetiporus sulphureus 93-53 TaxID=1314785 RepID=A0A165H861_9APHY|nr:uncharacterized protein LAESUDRAFT_734247 [Laetiporus sulphureus 93-53]KZT11379.1 hypothetical protein LAESUDRAFT_734247 [Laetiporus sulphureus 93-53]
MSRPTPAELINSGSYLDPKFDPYSLTIQQILGIFGYHNIKYPSQYTKGKLVLIWEEELKPQIDKFKKERQQEENRKASNRGIKDGATGKLLSEEPQPVRRSSRRLSKAPAEQESPAPAEQEPAPAKRRRASAQPSLGGPSRRRHAKPAEPAVAEESEPEEDIIVHKVGRSKKSTTDAASQARRVSNAFPEDSGWEDNNVFQSGAESSPTRRSPARSRARRTAPSRASLKSQKSMSAPPEYISSPEREKGPEEMFNIKPTPSIKPSSLFKISAEVKSPSGSKLASPSKIKPLSGRFSPRLPPGMARERAIPSPKAESAPAVPMAQPVPRVSKPEESIDLEEQQQLDALRTAISEESAKAQPEPSEEKAEGGIEKAVEEKAAVGSDTVVGEEVLAVSQRISEGGQVAPARQQPAAGGHSLLLRCFVALLALASSGLLYQYKNESSEIGFCDTGKTTNAILESHKEYYAAVDSCNRENRTTLYFPNTTAPVGYPTPPPSAAVRSAKGDSNYRIATTGAEACPLPFVLSIPHPETCTPCPKHARCTPSTMTCENGYVLRPHPLLTLLPVPGTPSPKSPSTSLTVFTRPGSLFATDADVPQLVYSAISLLSDGLPGVGPVALPPRCVEDPRRKRHIGALGKAVEALLAAERGRRLCEGVGVGLPEGDDLTEARRWGFELDKLKDELRKKTAPNLRSTLDDTFNEAIQQLVNWGGVFMAEDKAEGKRYIAHKTPTMGWDCIIKVKARDAWMEWRKSVVGTAVLVMGILALRRRRAQNAVENERVASLVQVALDLLRNQEMSHHTDPVSAPRPYLSSVQLRDLVLQQEHSVGKRQRLWERVERVVEGNANVRTNLEEVEGGDELRVWRWVGSTGQLSSSASGGAKDTASG